MDREIKYNEWWGEWWPIVVAIAACVVVLYIMFASSPPGTQSQCDAVTTCERWTCMANAVHDVQVQTLDLVQYQVCEHDHEIREYGYPNEVRYNGPVENRGSVQP